MTKLKAFADDKLNVAKVMISLFDREENTVGKRENAGNQHFLLFRQCFPKPSSVGTLKVGIVWYRVNAFPHCNVPCKKSPNDGYIKPFCLITNQVIGQNYPLTCRKINIAKNFCPGQPWHRLYRLTWVSSFH